jgi:DNA-binding MarR family transcriptional regulator
VTRPSPSPVDPTAGQTPPDLAGPNVAELAHDLRLACMRVSRRVRFESAQDTAPHQFSVLARLEAGPAAVGDLAEVERVRAPSMSRTVAGLQEAGLVCRDVDPADGRVALISLTEHGKETLARERARRDAWMAHRLEGLAAEDRETLREATVLLDQVLSQ